MPKGPRGEHRPADVIGGAVMVGRIATDEEADLPLNEGGKDASAVAIGRKGGTARAAAMTPERRAEIAKAAVVKRWVK